MSGYAVAANQTYMMRAPMRRSGQRSVTRHLVALSGYAVAANPTYLMRAATDSAGRPSSMTRQAARENSIL